MLAAASDCSFLGDSRFCHGGLLVGGDGGGAFGDHRLSRLL